mgnify:CR=1 FL=1
MDREEKINNLLDSVKPNFKRWCSPGKFGCACFGCFNFSEQDKLDIVNQKLKDSLTKEEFYKWLSKFSNYV